MATNKIRVLCIGRDLKGGGAERVQLTLLRSLDRNRFTPTLYYLNDAGSLSDLIPPDLTPIFASRGSVNLKVRGLQVFRHLVRLARENDVVLAMQDGTPSYLGILAAKCAGKPVINWRHGLWSCDVYPESAWKQVASRILYPLSDRCISVTRELADQLVARKFVRTGRSVAIPNPVCPADLLQMSLEAPPDWSDAVFRVPTILAVGRLVRCKRFDILLQAFRRVIDRGLDANLLIVGEGSLRDELQDFGRQLGIAERVFMPGFCPNPYPLFLRATALALSSQAETLGMVLVEALSLGLPIVSADCPVGPSDVLERGRYGLLVPTLDAQALADGLCNLLQNERLRSHLSLIGRDRAKDYDIHNVCMSFERELAGLLPADRQSDPLGVPDVETS